MGRVWVYKGSCLGSGAPFAFWDHGERICWRACGVGPSLPEEKDPSRGHAIHFHGPCFGEMTYGPIGREISAKP